MITVVSGKIGSGKTLDMVRIIARHLRNGGAVRTNIHLNLQELSRAAGRRLYHWQYGNITQDTDPTEIPRGDFRGRGRRRCLVVLDEALNWFDSTSSKDVDLKSRWGSWLRQSDKLGQDVYFIAQNFDRAAKWIRELAQVNREIVPIRTLRVFGFLPIGLFIPFGASTYIVQAWDVRSLARLSTELHRYSSLYWRCYDTSETFGFVATRSAFDVVQYPQFRIPLFFIVSPFLSLLALLLCALF